MAGKFKKPKIIVILGPTASGKTKLAVHLAYKFGGEIISADSRQVYKGMDIGTGKDLKEYEIKPKTRNPKLKIFKIPRYLIDVANPQQKFSLAKYQKLAFKTVEDIAKRGKLPILAGGTGLYAQAVVENFQLSKAKPDLKRRKELERENIAELLKLIKKLSPSFAKKIDASDKKNKRRLVRYLEILESDQKFKSKTGEEKYDALILGIRKEKEELEKRIYKRLIERLEKEKLVDEIKRLRKDGLGWKRLESFGLEYKFISLYLQKKLSYDEMVEKLFIAIRQFSKRQMTWFRRWERQGRRIYWIKNEKAAEKLAKQFLK